MNFKFSRHDLPASAVLLLISDQAASRHFTELLSVRLYDITQIEVLSTKTIGVLQLTSEALNQVSNLEW